MQDMDYTDSSLVSVIIPTYNRPDYLKKSLESAVNQTYRNLEIIVSDNASEVSPEELVKSFNDSRIHFYRHERNIGMLANVQSAFLRANGKYVASLLDDDLWESEFVERLVLPLEEHPDLALSFCDHFIIDDTDEIDHEATEICSRINSRATLKEGIHRSPITELGLVNGAISTAMAALIRRDVLDWERMPSEVDVLWDVYVSYCCCISGLGAYYCPEKLTRVREHAQSETQQGGRKNIAAKIRKGKAQAFCYEMLMKDDRLQPFQHHFHKLWTQAKTTLGIGLIRDSKPHEARSVLWQSLQSHMSMRTFTAWLISFLPPSIACRF